LSLVTKKRGRKFCALVLSKSIDMQALAAMFGLAVLVGL